MHIAGGSVTYGRTVKPADYESKKVEVTLTFGLEDSAVSGDDAIAQVSEMAKRGVDRMLKLKDGEAPPAVAASTKETAAANLNAADKPKTSPKPPKAATKPAETKPEPKAEPAKDEWDTETETATPAKEVTDKDLHEAVTRKNAELKKKHEGEAPVMIRKLIASYFKKEEAQGKSLKDIPQEERADFISELEKLS